MEKTYFEWDDDFLTGNNCIDKQHYSLVEIINELLKISLGSNRVEINRVLFLKERLEQYVIVHFTTEEDLMEEYSVYEKHLNEHKTVHSQFVDEVTTFFCCENNYDTTQKLGEMVEYLIRWLAYHILNMDKSLVGQLNYIQNQKMTPYEAYKLENETFEASTESLLKALKVLYRIVSEKNKEIEAYNHELEDKVQKRTKELEEANMKLEGMLNFDYLTGLPNRRFVMNKLNELLNEWERYKVPFTVLFIDLNKFKMVNDLYGHKMGDKILKWSADYFKNSVRKTDIVCRLSGDEFVVICTHTNTNESIRIAEKIGEIAKCSLFDEVAKWIPSVSIGIATVSSENNTANKIMKIADQRMYYAKKECIKYCLLD